MFEIKTNSFTKLLEKLNFSMMENVGADTMTNGDLRPMPVRRVVDYVTTLSSFINGLSHIKVVHYK